MSQWTRNMPPISCFQLPEILRLWGFNWLLDGGGSNGCILFSQTYRPVDLTGSAVNVVAFEGLRTLKWAAAIINCVKDALVGATPFFNVSPQIKLQVGGSRKEFIKIWDTCFPRSLKINNPSRRPFPSDRSPSRHAISLTSPPNGLFNTSTQAKQLITPTSRREIVIKIVTRSSMSKRHNNRWLRPFDVSTFSIPFRISPAQLLLMKLRQIVQP